VIFAVSLPLALLLGVAVAAFLSHLDPRIFTRIDLARASGLPVLGAHRSAARSGASAA
jgi:capsular polysaccharide biosynthesis protein